MTHRNMTEEEGFDVFEQLSDDLSAFAFADKAKEEGYIKSIGCTCSMPDGDWGHEMHCGWLKSEGV